MERAPRWLSAREDRAWRSTLHAHQQLALHLQRELLRESELTVADYEVLAALTEHPDARMPAHELATALAWETSRLSHQTRRMRERGLLDRVTNPADGRGCLVILLPAGREAIEIAAPGHVRQVRRHFIDLLTADELEVMTAVHDRIQRHLAEFGQTGEGHPS
jgi:DNA-binding MarR family transcriptional regulator